MDRKPVGGEQHARQQDRRQRKVNITTDIAPTSIATPATAAFLAGLVGNGRLAAGSEHQGWLTHLG